MPSSSAFVYSITYVNSCLFFLLAYAVPNYNNEVYGESSICVEVNETTPSDPDCLPRMGTPQCHQRQLLRERESDELAFNISINGI